MSTPRRPDSANDSADDTERDAWLSEALRHAPDAQAAPPPALSESILRQAHAAARAVPATARPRSALDSAWAWLVRPPVAASFASLLVATTVGVMWWDRPLDETLVRPPVATPSPQPAPAPERQAATPPPPERAAPPPARADADTAAAAREKPMVRKPQTSRAEPKAKQPEREPERARVAAESPPEAREPASAPASPAGPAPSPSTDNATAAGPSEAPRTTESALLSRSAPRAAAPSAASTAQQRPNAREPRPPALTALLDAIAAQPERWTWQRAGAAQPMNSALQRWLVQLDNAAASYWRSTTDPAAPPAASVLRLYRDGTLTATLHLTDDAIWLAPTSQAALPAASMAALKQALDEATP